MTLNRLTKLCVRIFRKLCSYFISVETLFKKIGAIFSRRYYFEDYVRVYPDGILFDKYGRKIPATKREINNFLNHCKFYKFASQFVAKKKVSDIGCGSGYGCEILFKTGASQVCGADISSKAIEFAQSHYGQFAEYSVQKITELKDYQNNFFDVSISSEVLEHLKEYGKEQLAINELKRITKPEGLIIIGTPNNELLEDHGFAFDEIRDLLDSNFKKYRIFENALVPYTQEKIVLWEKRLKNNNTGEIITQKINLSETVLPDGILPEIKKGKDPGYINFYQYKIDTSLLHNTHSWVIVVIKS